MLGPKIPKPNQGPTDPHAPLSTDTFLHLELLLYPTFYNFHTKFNNINEHWCKIVCLAYQFVLSLHNKTWQFTWEWLIHYIQHTSQTTQPHMNRDKECECPKFGNINLKSSCRSQQVLSRVHWRCYKLSISHFLKHCDTRTTLAKPVQPVIHGAALCCLQHSIPLPTETF